MQHLKKQPQLAQKLGGLLPPGTDVMQAASGFKNLGQFVAAVHVSNNQGIPFTQLKEQMVAPNNKSLGQAVQTLKPGTTTEAVTQAEAQASVEVKVTTEQPKTTSTTTTTTTVQAKAKKKTTGSK